jgi:hypothetical protein
MKKLTLNVETLGVESFSTAPEMGPATQLFEMISKKSCIEQCTTSCTPTVG